MRRAILLIGLFPLLGLVACAESSDEMTDADAWENPADQAPDPYREPQTVSLLGEELWALEDTAGVIAVADSALAADPDNVDRLIEAGRERRHAWHYRQAIELYSRAIELAPDDWRPYRFRGHRHLSLRDYERAIDDLETAREKAPLNWDVSYHLGLAYFLDGQFDQAAEEYVRCLDLADDPAARDARNGAFRPCAANEDDPESLVAMTEWTVRALKRAGRDDEAERFLASLPSDLSIEENVAYHHNLLFYRGEMTADELLEPGEDAPYRLETVGFGVANWLLAEGDTARAREILERLATDPWWPGFGRIAAETELARLDGLN